MRQHAPRPAGKLAFQVGADARSSPVQEDALVTLGDAEQRAGFLRAPTLHVSQRDHLASQSRKPLDRFPNDGERLRLFEEIVAPGLRRTHPSTSLRGTGPEEPIRRHRIVCVFFRERGERNGSPLAGAARPGAIGDDAVHPAAKGATALESRQAGENAHPGFLHDFLGARPGRDEQLSVSDHRGVLTADQGREGIFVARKQVGDEARVIARAWFGLTRSNRRIHGSWLLRSSSARKGEQPRSSARAARSRSTRPPCLSAYAKEARSITSASVATVSSTE